jgi:hypothetical protein
MSASGAVMVNEDSPQIFSGWKEIANYLRRGVRTIQRYELEQGLPVHRPIRKSKGFVVATKAELDGWVTAGWMKSRPSRQALDIRANRIRANFLLIDSQTALTFSGIALSAVDPAKRKRTSRVARRAYDTITQLRNGVDLSDVDGNRLDANLERLRRELQNLGESI